MGGWDHSITQHTQITPAVVSVAVDLMQQIIDQFNTHLSTQQHPTVQLSSPVGSTTYYQIDSADRVYGDIDIQLIVPDIPQLSGCTTSRVQSYWKDLLAEYVQQASHARIHPQSAPGHLILNVGDHNEQWVQVDLIPHTESLAHWGKHRTMPQRGVKGLLMGNVFSVLGSCLNMSIQHNGVQLKMKNGQRVSFAKRKDVELITVSTNIEQFVHDIFVFEAQQQNITDPILDPLLIANPGLCINNVQIRQLIQSVKGLARSFELNNMFDADHLSQHGYHNANSFIGEFAQRYRHKAEKDINSTKRDKATTVEALQRAIHEKAHITEHLDQILEMLYDND